ncbi:hypothetical protein EVAR_87505_1 [Eumeta japonica]|uniref:Uncharacterized protein n=1 Tax=Eumeta variegata TaxID=151549 RepID=A0A4C1ZB48_EUMVA|nr:hypothetical protein EVAR_87505_1 [Eumeta japonica]
MRYVARTIYGPNRGDERRLRPKSVSARAQLKRAHTRVRTPLCAGAVKKRETRNQDESTEREKIFAEQRERQRQIRAAETQAPTFLPSTITFRAKSSYGDVERKMLPLILN